MLHMDNSNNKISLQLVGDSIFRRLLNTHNLSKKFHPLSYQTCVSGQTVHGLKQLLKSSAVPLESHVCVLIGINDIVRDDMDEEMLHLVRGKGVPDHVISLNKVGAVCLIMRNLNIEQGLVNGTNVVIEAISNRLIRVWKANTNEYYGIPRITFKFPVVDGSPLLMTRRQFPLQLTYAMSIHKSQGQTIKRVGVDLRTDCFTHGQLYVALSRVRSPENIIVLVPPDRVHSGVAYTKRESWLVHRGPSFVSFVHIDPTGIQIDQAVKFTSGKEQPDIFFQGQQIMQEVKLSDLEDILSLLKRIDTPSVCPGTELRNVKSPGCNWILEPSGTKNEPPRCSACVLKRRDVGRD